VKPKQSIFACRARNLLRGWALIGLLSGCAVAAPPLSTTSAQLSPPSPQAFSFALLGDAPYGPKQVPVFERLIEQVNADQAIRFSIHVGDIKGSGESCGDEFLSARRALFQRFHDALILTPGDNDWTDCHRAAAGRFNPVERLGALRRIFYADPRRTLGQAPMTVEPQSAHAGFEPFVENALFERNGIVFATIHVVGSGNNLDPWSGIDSADSVARPRADRRAEFESRQAAALHWLDLAFDRAEQSRAAGLFLVIHAYPFFDLPATDTKRAGFNAFVARLQQRAAAFARPVVLAHGDFHNFTIDQPFDLEHSDPRAPLFTRVQVFGSPNVHWLRLTADPARREVFQFEVRHVGAVR
jgi:hypothetical protein